MRAAGSGSGRSRVKQATLDLGLAAGPSLANFVVGPNAGVWQHLGHWCAQPAPARPAVPLYLWGEGGSGKSHLLQAVRAALLDAGERVGWLDASVALPPDFDEGWSAVLLDDVQAFGAVQQHAAFNWFVNAAAPASGAPRPVLAAGRWPPADLPLREDLRTRLGWGHVFQLHAPSEAERRAVLRQQAEARGIALSDEVMAYMLSRFARDLGSLMALLERIDRFALEQQRAVTVPLIKSMLENE